MNRSWYIAEAQKITPEYYESYGTHDAPADSCGMELFTIGFWFLATVIVIPYVAIRSRKRPAATA